MKILRILSSILVFVVIFLSAYFIKCQLGICLIKNFPLDKYPPLSWLQDRNPYHIVYAPRENDDLLPNDFSLLQGAEIWNPLWRGENGMVRVNYTDRQDHATGIIIDSQSTKGWEIGHKKLIQVSAGDPYFFSGWIKTSGEGVVGSLSVITYDSGLKQLQWGYAMQSVAGKQDWQFVKGEFKVPEGAKFLRFQISGYGVGQAEFSELKFEK